MRKLFELSQKQPNNLVGNRNRSTSCNIIQLKIHNFQYLAERVEPKDEAEGDTILKLFFIIDVQTK